MVSAYTGLLRDRYQGKLDEKADQYLAFILEGAQRMRFLINDLLAYSRVGGKAGSLAPVAVQESLGSALTDLRAAREEARATITQDAMPVLTADGLQLAHVFQNLIGNAIKFRRTGEAPEIHVGAQRAEGCWMFSVRDNGIGIDPQFSDRIFEIFQRLHSRASYAGTGIGLAICRKIVECHGGRVWVESQLGKGSTFYFTIPDIPPGSPRAAGLEEPSPVSGRRGSQP
jgi:chemotaxis family two-component system sensor kinase Cph1